MKKLLTTLLISFYFSSSFCQYSNVLVKEQYDLNTTFWINYYNFYNLDISNDEGVLGDGISHILDGYLTMYKTTSDKGYLYNFILQSMSFMNNRHDIAYDLNSVLNDDLTGIEDEPRWGILTYHDGYILGSLAHFVHYIKMENNNLYNFPLHQFPDLQNNPFGLSFNTFGDYAEWLSDRITESLNWYINNNYWSDEYAMKNFPEDDYSLEINKQIGFARAFLFLGRAENHQSYIDKAMLFSTLFKSQIEFTDRCGSNQEYDEKLLIKKPNNSYWWYHAGWKIFNRDCSIYNDEPEYEAYTRIIDDMSHGAVTMYFPIESFNYQTSTPFNNVDMIRFRNTFTKNLYDGNGGFYNNVKGSDFPIDGCLTNCPHDSYASSCLMYMPYERFDAPVSSSGIGVYGIIMEYYMSHIANGSTAPIEYCCGKNKGHAETVQAQWKRECPSLTIYNRDVVYSQDFFVKNNLTIDPTSGPGLSYADPIISDPNFIVEPSVSSEFKAGNSIHFKPGIHFKEGSEIHAYIEPQICKKNKSAEISNNLHAPDENIDNEITPLESLNVPAKEEILKSEFGISPNPFNSFTKLDFSTNETSEVKIIIEDLMGKTVAIVIDNSTVEQGNHSHLFQDSVLENGVYYCSYFVNGQLITKEKLIKYHN